MKKEKIKQSTLDSLPEYSLSQPTGAWPGKVWKRNVRWGQGGPPEWVICEYVESPGDPNMLRTEYRQPEIVE